MIHSWILPSGHGITIVIDCLSVVVVQYPSYIKEATICSLSMCGAVAERLSSANQQVSPFVSGIRCEVLRWL